MMGSWRPEKGWEESKWSTIPYNMPGISGDEVGMIFEAGADAMARKLVEWGEEYCTEHHTLPFPQAIGGGTISRDRKLKRKTCPKCWQALRREVGLEE